MNRTKIGGSRLVVFLISMLLVASSNWARASEAHSVQATKQLQELLSSFSAFEGSFSQAQFASDNTELSRSSGQFTLVRPDQIRWETLQPFPQLLVTSGQAVWLYDPDLEQATVSPLSDQLVNTPAVLFSSDANAVEASYWVSMPESDRFLLVPKSEHSQFKRLTLVFSDGMPRSMSLVDGFGQRTDITFSDTELDQPVPAERFEFSPPKGTDILRHE